MTYEPSRLEQTKRLKELQTQYKGYPLQPIKPTQPSPNQTKPKKNTSLQLSQKRMPRPSIRQTPTPHRQPRRRTLITPPRSPATAAPLTCLRHISTSTSSLSSLHLALRSARVLHTKPLEPLLVPKDARILRTEALLTVYALVSAKSLLQAEALLPLLALALIARHLQGGDREAVAFSVAFAVAGVLLDANSNVQTIVAGEVGSLDA